MARVKDVYNKLIELEDKLKSDLRKAFFLSQNFQAYGDYSREYLKTIGKEVDYTLVEKAVRKSRMMEKIWRQLDKTKHSYNDLVREISLVRRDSIAKHEVTTEGPDDVHSITDILNKYEIDPNEDTFSKACHLISQTRKDVIEKRYGKKLIRRTEWIIPNNMTISDFIFLIKNGKAAELLCNSGYATSTYKNEQGEAKK
ncbi:hypothetical protein KY330_03815 [Candidatus Woesearchaeota archaeon]|nr:hypothetical protein [Candidatus Woesearchaeota archaeon]